MTGRTDGLLRIWACLAGFLLWVPAWAVPGLALPLQPLDLWVLAGLPLGVARITRLSPAFIWIALSLVAAQGLSLLMAGGEPLILAHGVIFAFGFMLTIAVAVHDARARSLLVAGVLTGAGLSVVLFAAQILIGAQHLDFRTNSAFSLPQQFGRGFALMPEVSTFAVHGGIALAMVLALWLSPQGPQSRTRLGLLGLGLVGSLMLSRSTSFLIVTPVLCLIAIAVSRRLDALALLRLGAGLALASVLLAIFFSTFYAERLETASASRSAAMRLASVLGGLSPLWSGEFFGVGLGQNSEITRRAFDIGRALDLSFGQLPQGVNSQIVARIFEEGWPAVLQFGLAFCVLIRSLRKPPLDAAGRALVILALGSLLEALLVTGYRGIFTNWLWLALPSGLLGLSPVSQRMRPAPA